MFCPLQAPAVKLDDKHCKLVDKMEALVEAYPSMLECKSLKVTGPVKFAAGVALKGDCVFTNNGTEVETLMAGEYANTTLDLTAALPSAAHVPV
jgi:UTP--glucose-1-phosphate uridylyltransferase/phosphoglucomutase